MRLHLSKQEVRQGYKTIKHLAQLSFKQGETAKALELINHCAIIAQQFNWIYADDELEDLLSDIGRIIIPNPVSEYTAIPNHVVFYDDFCTSFVLALQYLRALVADGKEILYITSRDIEAQSKFSTIIDEVESYPNTQVYVVPQGESFQRIQSIYNAIISFRPSKVMLHMMANSVALPAFYHLPSIIDRYIINLADQTFWLGKKAIDYSLEFRPFGVSVSLQMRGLQREQLLMVPFYPIVDNNPFEGFPPQCTSDKVIIFSGGDLYKIIDRKKMFWKLVKGILDEHPNVVFLFASKVNHKASEIVNRFVEENNFQDRFIYINYRKDISEVFKHCDIYMGTCPASGSLMSQLAAIHSKPILQYYYPETPDDETEQAICYNESFSVSFTSKKTFLAEARRLISDDLYRVSQGAKLFTALIRIDQFNKTVSDCLNTPHLHRANSIKTVNYTCLENRWFNLEKLGYIDTLPYIYGILGGRMCLKKVPSAYIKKKTRTLISRLY